MNDSSPIICPFDPRPSWLFDHTHYTTQFLRRYGREFDSSQLGDSYEHFLNIGQFQRLSGHPLFDPDVYQALATYDIICKISRDGPFTTFLRHSRLPGCEPISSTMFDPGWYLKRYPQVLEDIVRGVWTCALHHYLANGAPTAFDPSPNFSECGYLREHPDVSQAVQAKHFRNGYAHFLVYGRDEQRRYFPAGTAERPGIIPGIPALRDYPLETSSYSDVTLLPSRRDGSGRYGHSFGVLDSSGFPIADFEHPWFVMRNSSDTPSRDDRTFIYGGVLMDHFGHVIRDSLAHLWFIRERPELPVLWHWIDLPVPHRAWPGWLDQLWRLLGFDQREHVFVSVPLSVAQIILPQSGLVAPDLLHERQVDALAARRIVANVGSRGRLWLSRRGLPTQFGRLEGEDTLEAVLAARGWEILRPETLPVAAQIDLFATAEVIAGCMSSAFHAALLLEAPRAKFLLIERPGIEKPFYDAVARAKKLQQIYITPMLRPYSNVSAWTTFSLIDAQALADEICVRAI
ncbi:MAG: glycosyltransferase 61 family protein [Acidiphilium sp.]